ncbi:hypothetical protein CS053_11025 [Rhodanobacter glycinis]|uniref:Uncharacterized protein n=1 Tax=Rhodanobacter glycinis TaxID=582702 RepID=A0A5B9DZF3_9GAMM|nr:hypothetical protein [Rhodanobacter glycinis]QEE24968.1 hypothetical protein CS053_11025 [Rhodanobacter glycinis]
MSFKLPKPAGAFFRLLLQSGSSGFETMFDAYYFCLMVGLDARTVGTEDEVGEEFVRDYVQSFQPYSDLIAGLLIDAELDRARIDPSDRGGVEKKIVELLNPNSATKLSDVGHALLNRYSAGGFNLLRDDFVSPPQVLEDFLITYHRRWSTG